MKATQKTKAVAVDVPMVRESRWYGRTDWRKWKRRDPSGTLCGIYGYLAYCCKCAEPFATKDFLRATDDDAVCENCHVPSRNYIAGNAFSPDRKEAR